jgi:hypothetical protein
VFITNDIMLHCTKHNAVAKRRAVVLPIGNRAVAVTSAQKKRNAAELSA